MSTFWKTFALLSAAALILLLVIGLLALFGPIFVPLLLLLGLIYGWIFQTFWYYRVSRQDEFLQLLDGAAEAGAPVVPSLQAYLGDRPTSAWRSFCTCLLQFFLLPGYYWLWHRRHNYDQKLARVAQRLEHGCSLQEALESEPGVASPTTRLAVAVGESTGHLALSLRRSSEGPLATVWLETVPRLLYPIGLLIVLFGVGSFWVIYLLPRMMRIFRDFGMQLPWLTLQLAQLADWCSHFAWLLVLGFLGLLTLAILAFLNPQMRWYLPGFRRLYRMSVQSRILKMLAVMLEAEKPLPEALSILSDSGVFPFAVCQSLHQGRTQIEQGQTLPDVLSGVGLLPAHMAPLVRAAERARNLPWALTELGNNLASRAVWLRRRLSLFLFSTSVVLVGLLVGFMVVGMFMPLVKLISEIA